MSRSRSAFRVPLPAALAAFAFTVSGCASQPASPPRRDLLDFLNDPRAKCDELGDHLGSPSGTYEGGRLITYRIAEDGQQRYLVVKQANWSQATHTLAVTCGADGTVARHTLVAVKTGGQEK
jgi:hypothetical protein